MKIKAILDAKGSTDVYAVNENSSLSEFVREACAKETGAMMVTSDAGEVVGIITERDVLRECNKKSRFDQVKIGDVMTRKIVTVQADDDINTAMDYMITMKIRHLPVLDGKDIAGLITIRDLIMAMRKADDRETKMLVDYLRQSLEARGAKSA